MSPLSPTYDAISVATSAAIRSSVSSENWVWVRRIIDPTAIARVNSSADAKTASMMRYAPGVGASDGTRIGTGQAPSGPSHAPLLSGSLKVRDVPKSGVVEL